MYLAARTPENATHGKPRLKDTETGIGHLNNESVAAFADTDILTDAVRLEIHEQLQDLNQSTVGYWQRITSDFESRVAVLEKSFENESFLKLRDPAVPLPHVAPKWYGRRTVDSGYRRV